jgi:hypothetical protein
MYCLVCGTTACDMIVRPLCVVGRWVMFERELLHLRCRWVCISCSCWMQGEMPLTLA